MLLWRLFTFWRASCSMRSVFLGHKFCANILQALLHYRPYTLTEMYYGRVALRYLMHTYLSVKWANWRVNGEQTPQRVLNFFLQWIDNDHVYPDNAVEEKVFFLYTILINNVHTAMVGAGAGSWRRTRLQLPLFFLLCKNLTTKGSSPLPTLLLFICFLHVLKVQYNRCTSCHNFIWKNLFRTYLLLSNSVAPSCRTNTTHVFVVH